MHSGLRGNHQSLENTHLQSSRNKMAQVITNIFTTTVSSGSLVVNKPISLQEVSWHDTFNDCWIVIYDRVYDITDFLIEHPGGEDILVEYAGRDATVAFRGSGHSAQAIKALDKYLIGELPQHERIFRKPGGIPLSDLPT